jgi:hypothetical protein
MKTWKSTLITTTAALIALGAAGAAQAETAPYEPGRGPGDIRQPWAPPAGPGDIRDTPATPPTGPGAITNPDRPTDPGVRFGIIPIGCVGGKMIDFSYDSGSWLPSSAWRVHLWVYKTSAGNDMQHEFVQRLDQHGEFVFCPSKSDYGKPFLYTYETQNDDFRLEDARDDTDKEGERDRVYWASPHNLKQNPPKGGIWPQAQNMPASSNTPAMNLGTFKLDTGPETNNGVKNEIYAVGDIMRWGTQMTDKLQANGLRSDRSLTINNVPMHIPHELHYPSKTHSCNSLVATCYDDFSDKIYLALNTDTDDWINRFTVQHELAHSLEDEYWGFVAGVGEHRYDECDADGAVAYSEGVADFVSVWAHNEGFSYDLQEDPFNIMSPNPIGCQGKPQFDSSGNGNHNEEYVAAALWDMHDHTNADDAWGENWDDTYGAQSDNGVVHLVLNHPVLYASQLRVDYTAMYPSYKHWIDSIFGMNHIESTNPSY